MLRMMLGFLKEISRRWRARKLARAKRVLSELKVSYHTFRILLDNNERSLELLGTVGRLLETVEVSHPELAEKVEELLSVTYELVDGVNRLTGHRHVGLYKRHQALASAIRLDMEKIPHSPMTAPSCIPLSEITPQLRSSVGGKASELAMLKQVGFPVPDGFSISATACCRIITENGLDSFLRRRLRRVGIEGVSPKEVEADAEEIRRRLLDVPIPEALSGEIEAAYNRLTATGRLAVSVRSSALGEDMPEHTFAGQFKSVLNVTCFEDLRTAVKEVIASNFGPRSIYYRIHARLPLVGDDMAVLCQLMVHAKAAGVLFTRDPTAPESGRVLLSAVPGLGTLAVGGAAPADVYRPLRSDPESEPFERWAEVEEKTDYTVSLPGGGVQALELPGNAKKIPVLSRDEALALVRLGRGIESLLGRSQDIEWAMDGKGEIHVLQARAVRFARAARRAVEENPGEVLLSGGICASPGRRIGRVKIVHSIRELEKGGESEEPRILVLHQSSVDVARWLPAFDGVIVDFGNPADHLSCVAREYSRPMLTGTGRATEVLQEGRWVILDADRAAVFSAPDEVPVGVKSHFTRPSVRELERPARNDRRQGWSLHLHELIETLNLTDAYGPTFSIMECRSLHDIIRYVHETAVLAMFEAGDSVMEGADMLLRRLDEGVPFHFFLIDLGGGIVEGSRGFKVDLDDVVSAPFLALWEGLSAPELWGEKPGFPRETPGLLVKSMLDAGAARPTGLQNYALVSKDYLNLNARVDYHFAMVDSVCGANPTDNYIRFRFKGGGTTLLQRERRARFIVEVLESNDFFADRQGDLVTASLQHAGREETGRKLNVLGRLLGFSRLRDAAMLDDGVPHRLAEAFLAGDYGQ